eukprot:jgi/Bigna1/84590/fgenesh1_pg.165_\
MRKRRFRASSKILSTAASIVSASWRSGGPTLSHSATDLAQTQEQQQQQTQHFIYLTPQRCFEPLFTHGFIISRIRTLEKEGREHTMLASSVRRNSPPTLRYPPDPLTVEVPYNLRNTFRRIWLVVTAIATILVVYTSADGRGMADKSQHLGIFDCCASISEFRDEMQRVQNGKWSGEESDNLKYALTVLREDASRRDQRTIGQLFKDMRNRIDPSVEQMQAQTKQLETDKEKVSDERGNAYVKVSQECKKKVEDLSKQFQTEIDKDGENQMEQRAYEAQRYKVTEKLLHEHHELLSEKEKLRDELRKLREASFS